MTTTDVFLKVLRAAMWGETLDWKGRQLTHMQYASLMSLAREQEVAGLVGQALMDSGVRLEREDALEVFGIVQQIRQRNAQMDEAVVTLCHEMEAQGIRFFVFKGQTLAPLYPDGGLRQCGDIDFFVYPEDWKKAVELLKVRVERDEVKDYVDNTTEKDVQYTYQGVAYEMHRMLTLFMYPKHSRYWENVVMGEITGEITLTGTITGTGTGTVEVKGDEVPTLAATYNALYVFVHIFQHLISDGIGLRQFVDWARVLNDNDNGNEKSGIDVAILQKHLEGIGLRKAYSGLGAILTDYLGLPEEKFPFAITEDDHKKAPALFENMIEMGNFGHNKHYKKGRGVVHGIQHLGRITLQARRFYHYAPAEAWWHIPYMFKWWGKKVCRMMFRR